MSWEAVYGSDWQAVWALWIAPVAFLLFRMRHGPMRRGADTATRAFVDAYCVWFALETLIDPVCTTLGIRWLGGSGSLSATVVGLLFVLLGDFRVFLLVLGVSRDPARTGWNKVVLRSALLTALVPALAYALFLAGGAFATTELDGRWLFLAHEALFVGLALGLRQFWRRRGAGADATSSFVRAVLGYSALYYLLWATADVLILAGIDAGFALRIIPNQLYYAFWIPFVWWRFPSI